jgi:hypothetical protein
MPPATQPPFMWSDRVTVISRPRRGAAADTKVLDFSGLARRPLLRPASGDEQLPSSGTLVRLRLPGQDLTALDPQEPHDGLARRDRPPRELVPVDGH